MNFYIQVYYINFYVIKLLLYEKYGMLQKATFDKHKHFIVMNIFRLKCK